MRQHLLRVTLDADAFKTLIHTIHGTGQRVGWLELGADTPNGEDPGSQPPESLDTAADLGVLRAVTVAKDRTVMIKPRRGAPVLKDLLREYFRGCLVVLVRGELPDGGTHQLSAAPRLEPRGEDWLLQVDGESARELETEAVIRTLQRRKRLS